MFAIRFAAPMNYAREKSSRGDALIEAAIVAPILMLLFCLAIDFGLFLYNQWVVYNAALPAAIELAARHKTVAHITSVAEEVMNEQGFKLTNLSVTAAEDDPADIITVTISATFNFIIPFPGSWTGVPIGGEMAGYYGP